MRLAKRALAETSEQIYEHASDALEALDADPTDLDMARSSIRQLQRTVADVERIGEELDDETAPAREAAGYAYRKIRDILDRALGGEDAVNENLDEYNLRRALEDLDDALTTLGAS